MSLQPLKHKKCRLFQAAAFIYCESLLILILAFLIGNAAAGLASRLAGGLAFSATALFGAFAQITCFNGFDSFHYYSHLHSVQFICLLTLRKDR